MPRFNAIDVINRIERTFYNGEKNKDFILITKWNGAYVCAKKEHLPYNKLHNFHPVLKNSKETNDVIVFYEDQEDRNFISEFYLGLGTVMEIRKNRI